MFAKKKKSCKEKTRKLISSEKKRIMKETLGYLKQLREAIGEKQVA